MVWSFKFNFYVFEIRTLGLAWKRLSYETTLSTYLIFSSRFKNNWLLTTSKFIWKMKMVTKEFHFGGEFDEIQLATSQLWLQTSLTCDSLMGTQQETPVKYKYKSTISKPRHSNLSRRLSLFRVSSLKFRRCIQLSSCLSYCSAELLWQKMRLSAIPQRSFPTPTKRLPSTTLSTPSNATR